MYGAMLCSCTLDGQKRERAKIPRSNALAVFVAGPIAAARNTHHSQPHGHKANNLAENGSCEAIPKEKRDSGKSPSPRRTTIKIGPGSTRQLSFLRAVVSE